MTWAFLSQRYLGNETKLVQASRHIGEVMSYVLLSCQGWSNYGSFDILRTKITKNWKMCNLPDLRHKVGSQ